MAVEQRWLVFKRSRENDEVAAVLSQERRWCLGPGRGQRSGEEEAGKDVNFKSRTHRPHRWAGHEREAEKEDAHVS